MYLVEEKIEAKKERKSKAEEEIPAYLIYEKLGGVPVYFKGYRDVLNNTKKFEEIMVYGNLQWFLINMIKDYLQPFLGGKNWLLSGEGGLHISLNSNPSIDFAIVSKKAFNWKKARNKYLSIPPEVVIEVDTKADFSAYPFSMGDYYLGKTKILIEFGVKEVVWIFTHEEKVMVARPNQPWFMVDWKDEIEILGHRFTINQVIKASESEE